MALAQTPNSGHRVPLVAEEIATWLRAYVADLIDLPIDRVDGATTFDRYGLDSSTAVAMTADLSQWLAHDIDPSAAYDHPTIDSLAGALASDERIASAFRQRSTERESA